MQKIYVGMATCGVSAGADAVFDKIKDLIDKEKLPFELHETGCIGLCAREPIIEVRDEETGQSHIYVQVDPKKAEAIVKAHLEGKVAEEYLMAPEEREQYYGKQKKIVLRNCGVIDPHSIDEYIERDGYKAIEKVLKEMTPEQVIEEILGSGLRGRGGAGFPTGLKWKFARAAKGEPKYLIVNGDEGDPGAFMDRTVLESDPHSVIEGMLIGAYAIGARYGYAYIRAEYPRAVRHFAEAIEKARERGFLGENILGTDFSFDLRIKEGAGAFVCGEETALIASIEGHRGHPRTRPPYPAQAGLWQKPTNINNVETFANVPWIILHGAEEFAKMGTEKSKGTKVFALAGKTVRTGLVEVPMGITINEIVNDIAGGIEGGGKFKAVQMGGPSGGCIPAEMGDTPIDYERITATGAIMGSGGMIVLDDKTCMVEVARYFLEFTQKESCGKCIPCRIGTRRMLEILTRITQGEGEPEDLDKLEELAKVIKDQSRCGLGQTAPNPVLTTLKYFRHEYEAHIYDKKCPAHQCLPLVTFTIDPNKCTGCTLCAKSCPTDAIRGEPKKVHFIEQEKCIHCAGCFRVCPDDAVIMD